MQRFKLTCLGMGGFAALAIAATLAGPALARDPRASIEPRAHRPASDIRSFRAAEPDRLSALELASQPPDGALSSSSSPRVPVTDVLVEIRAAGDIPLGVALMLGDGDARGGGNAVLVLDLYLVAGGRLHVERDVRCGIWTAGAARCHLPCGGGTVALTRTRGANGLTFGLVIGDVVPGEAGARIGVCDEAGGNERIVAPRRGQRTVTVALDEEQVPASGRRR